MTWLLDTALQNSWQLHKKAGGQMSMLVFKRDVVCTMLRQGATVRSRNSSGGPRTGPIGARPGDDDLRYDQLSHYIEKRAPPRKMCAMEGCNSRCVTYCEKSTELSALTISRSITPGCELL